MPIARMQGLIARLLKYEKEDWPKGVLENVEQRGVKNVSKDPKGIICERMLNFYKYDKKAQKAADDMIEWQKMVYFRGSLNFWFEFGGKIVFVTRQLDSSTRSRRSSEWPDAMEVFAVDASNRLLTRHRRVTVPKQVDYATLKEFWDSVCEAASSDKKQECPICLCDDKEDEDMFRLTSCSHSVCNTCAQKLPRYREYGRVDKVECPVCKTHSDHI